jgi:hypothetical protein
MLHALDAAGRPPVAPQRSRGEVLPSSGCQIHTWFLLKLLDCAVFSDDRSGSILFDDHISNSRKKFTADCCVPEYSDLSQSISKPHMVPSRPIYEITVRDVQELGLAEVVVALVITSPSGENFISK